MAISVYNVMPIPPDEAATRFVEAAPLRIGVEYRALDDAGLDAAYSGNPADLPEINVNKPAGGFEDEVRSFLQSKMLPCPGGPVKAHPRPWGNLLGVLA